MVNLRTSFGLIGLEVIVLSLASAAGAADWGGAERIEQRTNDLRLSVYVTAHSVHRLATDEVACREALPALHRLGVTKVYLEAYRGGLVLSRDELVRVRDFFAKEGYPVSGGIATVPGGDFGVRANTGLTWFNWQNPKTQQDLAGVVRTAAGDRKSVV